MFNIYSTAIKENNNMDNILVKQVTDRKLLPQFLLRQTRRILKFLRSCMQSMGENTLADILNCNIMWE